MGFSRCFGKLASMLEWREREHEIDDAFVLNDNVTMNVLRECDLHKFFLCMNMRSQLLLLQQLVDMWDPNAGHFMVGDQILRLGIEDIYFLIGLSWRGMMVVLSGGWRESTEPVDQYIVQYC